MARRISTALLRAGMTLGRTLYDERGRILLQPGMLIKETYIPKIQKSFSSIYIDDAVSEGIKIPEAISPEFRMQVQQTLSEEWERLQDSVSFDRLMFRPQFAKSLREQMRTLLSIVKDTEIIQEDLASLASYDNMTYIHSVNVAIYSLIIGTALKLPDAMLVDLGVGAVLHDIGKIWVPIAVLNKPGRLTNGEFLVMKEHTRIGYEVLSYQPELSVAVAQAAYQHHERLMGNGYPRGLSADQIHQFAKIIAVADVYDAMVMSRPYREGLAPNDVMEFLYSKADIDFDLDIVSLFSKKVSMYPIGTEVHLSNGCTAVVAKLHRDVPARPVIRIVRNSDGCEISPVDIDLSRVLNLTITKSVDVSVLDSIDCLD